MITINLHASNINGKGLGSTNILLSFIPQLVKMIDRSNSFFVLSKSIEFKLIEYLSGIPHYFQKSYLPDSFFRVLECTLFTPKFTNMKNPLLTFGDLPLRYKARQTLFLQNILVIDCQYTIRNFKYLVMNMIFRINLKYVDKFIVQTEVMKKILVNNYKINNSVIDVIYLPPSEKILKLSKNKLKKNNGEIKLFYPASLYTHKNHILLSKINDYLIKKNCKIYLTINENEFHSVNKKMLIFLGKIEFNQVIEIYNEVDALLFLSEKESYGLPLIESMFMGLQIICPDLDYSKELCGNEAIYFKNLDSNSLENSIEELINRISSKKTPNWEEQLSKIETDWDNVAEKFIN